MIIEHRPRLQSANFFMHFNGPITDQEKINVVLRNDSVEIKRQKEDGSTVGGLLISTEGQLDVLTNSLSALVAKDGYLSFRVNTNSKCFQSELLRTQPNQLGQVDKLKCNVTVNEEYVIACGNCTRDLGMGKWTRILELPSENFDCGDWFCHKKIDFDITSPRQHELFYGYYYWLVNGSVFDAKKVIKKSQSVYCKRCLQYLGQKMNNNEDNKAQEEGAGTIKVWNENLQFRAKGGNQGDL